MATGLRFDNERGASVPMERMTADEMEQLKMLGRGATDSYVCEYCENHGKCSGSCRVIFKAVQLLGG